MGGGFSVSPTSLLLLVLLARDNCLAFGNHSQGLRPSFKISSGRDVAHSCQGLGGCCQQDCTHCSDDSVNSPTILQRIRRWNAGVFRLSSLQGYASDSCRHLPAKGLRICTWTTRGLLGSATSSQRPRESKLEYLKRIAEKSASYALKTRMED